MEELRHLTIAAVKYNLCYFRVIGKEQPHHKEQNIGEFWAVDMADAQKTASRLFDEDYYDYRIEQVYFTNGEPVTGKKQKELTEKCLVRF